MILKPVRCRDVVKKVEPVTVTTVEAALANRTPLEQAWR